MKILRLFFIIAILMNSAVLLAQNTMSLEVVQAEAGEIILAGAVVDVEIVVENEDVFAGFGLDIPLGDFGLVTGSFELTEERKDGHSFTATMQAGNTLRVNSANIDETTPFKGNDGPVARFQLQAPETPGEFTIGIVDAVLSDEDAVALPLGTKSATFTLTGNEIIIKDATSKINQIVNIDVVVNNYTPFTGFTVIVELPEEVGILTDTMGTVSATLNYDRAVEGDHEFSAIILSDNRLQLFCFSPVNTPFDGGEGGTGVVASFRVIAPGTAGVYSLTFDQAVVADPITETNIIDDEYPGELTVTDQNIVIIHDAVGFVSETISIDIEVDHVEEFTGFEVFVRIPTDLKFVEGSEQLTDRATDDHEITAVKYDEDADHVTYRIYAFSDPTRNFIGWDGNVASFDVVLPLMLPGGVNEYQYVIDFLYPQPDGAILAREDATEIENVGTQSGVITVTNEVRLVFVSDEDGNIDACAGQPIAIELLNRIPAAGFNTELILPEGITFVDAWLNEDRAPNHILTPPNYDPVTGIVPLIVFADPTENFIGTEGDILYIVIDGDVDTSGIGLITNTVISDENAVEITTKGDDVAFITLLEEPAVEVRVLDTEENEISDLSFCFDDTFLIAMEGVAGQGPWTVHYSIFGPDGFDDIVDQELGTGEDFVYQVDLGALDIPTGLYTLTLSSVVDANSCAATEETLAEQQLTVFIRDRITFTQPDNLVVDACDFEDQHGVIAAFNTWLDDAEAQANVTGYGVVTVTNNSDELTIPLLCDGGTITVTWTAENICEVVTFEASFSVIEPEAVTYTAPDDKEVFACELGSQEALEEAFDAWMAAALTDLAGGCTPTFTEDWDSEYPVLCTSEEIVVTWTITDLCYNNTVSATFKHNQPEEVTYTPPADEEVFACELGSQQALEEAFDAWIAAALVDLGGGCTPTFEHDWDGVYPELCTSEEIVVTWTITDLCYSNTVFATFEHVQPDEIEVTQPGNKVVETCDFDSQDEVQADFEAWIVGIIEALEIELEGQACDPVVVDPRPIDAPAWSGGSVEVTFLITDLCEPGIELKATYTVEPPTILEGTVTYFQFDKDNLPLYEGVTVSLVSEDGTVLASTTTGAGGAYLFDYSGEGETNLLLQTAHVEVSTTIPHGGLRGADALAVQRRDLELDVSFWVAPHDLFLDYVGSVNALPGRPDINDAFMINQRFVFPENFTSFEAGNWAFHSLTLPGEFFNEDNETGRLPYTGTYCELHIEARAFGDVRGDYNPLDDDKSFLPIQTEDVLNVGMNEVFQLPLFVQNDIQFNAMTLDIYFDEEKLEVFELHSEIPGLSYAISDGAIRVIFANVFNTQFLDKGEAILFLEMQTIAPVSAGDILFTQGHRTEFSDAFVNPISWFELGVYSLDNGAVNVTEPGDSDLVLNAYPNPFNDQLTVSYVLPAAADVRISIVNTMGAKVAELVSGKQEAGQHQVMFMPESADMPHGIYFIRMEARGEQSTLNKVLRAVYIR